MSEWQLEEAFVADVAAGKVALCDYDFSCGEHLFFFAAVSVDCDAFAF